MPSYSTAVKGSIRIGVAGFVALARIFASPLRDAACTYHAIAIGISFLEIKGGRAGAVIVVVVFGD